MKYSILLTGVGGQGLMLLSRIIGNACMRMGLKIVAEEQHGLAQRSGSIRAHIRIGEVYSPMIPYGSADLIISMEAMESLRYIEFLKPEGYIVSSNRILHPVIETSKIVKERGENIQYINLDSITEQLQKITKNVLFIDSEMLANEAGNPRTENNVLLGTASTQPDFPLEKTYIEEAIKKLVPERTIKVNLHAFSLGYEESLKRLN
jgi:indolepyruvate ferredoxin oxidoreductase beta subunit